MMMIRLGGGLSVLARAFRRLRRPALALDDGARLVTESGLVLIEE